MAIDFEPLRETMRKRGVSWYELAKQGIDNKTIDRIKHNRNTTMKTIDRLCDLLDCEVEEVIRRKRGGMDDEKV